MEEKTMRKRFLSLLLVLVCVLTLAAAPVAAAEPDAVPDTYDRACRPHDGADSPGRTQHRTQPRAQPGAQPRAHTHRPVVSGGDGFCLCARHPAR